jgi:PAS domain-containing protein
MIHLDLYLKIGGVIVAIFLGGWKVYEWLKINLIDPINEFKPELKKTMAEIQQIKKDFEILSNLKKEGNSPIIDKIIETHDTVERMCMLTEAKFELDNQAYFECDSSGYLIRANEAFYNVLDIPKENSYGNQWMNVINDSFQDDFIDKWNRLVNGGLQINEAVVNKKGGKFVITARRKPNNQKEAKVILGSICLSV